MKPAVIVYGEPGVSLPRYLNVREMVNASVAVRGLRAPRSLLLPEVRTLRRMSQSIHILRGRRSACGIAVGPAQWHSLYSAVCTSRQIEGDL